MVEKRAAVGLPPPREAPCMPCPPPAPRAANREKPKPPSPQTAETLAEVEESRLVALVEDEKKRTGLAVKKAAVRPPTRTERKPISGNSDSGNTRTIESRKGRLVALTEDIR